MKQTIIALAVVLGAISVAELRIRFVKAQLDEANATMGEMFIQLQECEKNK